MLELILLYCWIGVERAPCKELARIPHQTYVSCAYQGHVEVAKRNASYQKMFMGGEKTVAMCLPAGVNLDRYEHLKLLQVIYDVPVILPSPYDLPR